MMKAEGQYPKAYINLLLLALGLGIICARYTELCREAWTAVFITLAIMLLAAGIMAWLKSRYIVLITTLMMILLGMLRCSVALYPGNCDIQQWAEKDISIRGELQEGAELSRDKEGKLHVKYVVGNISLKEGSQEYACQGNIVVYARDNSFEKNITSIPNTDFAFEEYGRKGDEIQVQGRLMKLHDYQNPGRMDMVMANYAKGIHGQMSAGKYSVKILPVDKMSLGRVAGYIRHLYKAAMDMVMPKSDSAAIYAMLFGGYGGIREDLLEAFTVTGLIHILSVSGSHITLMAGVANIVGNAVGLSGTSTAALASIIIVAYSFLAGLVMPVVRSAVMGILTLLALTLGREKDAQHILSITALGILLLWPLSIFDISFQLSFFSTAGLLYLSPRIKGWFPKKAPEFVSGSLSVTIGAQLGSLPFIAWYFNVVSISSLLANLLVAPVLELIIVVSLFAGIAVGLIPVLGKAVFLFASLLLGLAYEATRVIGSLPGSQAYIPSMNWQFWCGYYLVLLLCLWPGEQWKRTGQWIMATVHNSGKREKYIGSMAMAVIMVCVAIYFARPGEMAVHYIDTITTTLIQIKHPSNAIYGL
ncbi:MAG: ComEC family competence protein [Anaerovibrio sp.]|uniref:ComEC/Rec2 family competence protein n=1 Tax=Anaerovibrio sp. TaxID=1872532 RepID=UPI0025FA325B|nr:ComEC/Rec2 family competence protein [Anaerovibrio sp.]MCR5175650.1 ComEC family competence protein [Anaerovibrio sp.]